MKSRTGQLHLSESIAVLFLFFILVFFGILFYYQYQKVSWQEQQEELLATTAMEITTQTLFLPELYCSRAQAEAEDNCYDLRKLSRINETFQKHLNDYYFNLFSYATITVHQLYPTSRDYVLYNKSFANYSRKEPTFFVVALRNTSIKGETSYGFGYLQVEVYAGS